MEKRVAGYIRNELEGSSAAAGGYALRLQGLFACQRCRRCMYINPGMAAPVDWSSNLLTLARPLSFRSLSYSGRMRGPVK
jgi:hypothetical protein